MTGICIFCQQEKRMSNEHIFPRWLQRYLGIQRKTLYIFSSDSEQYQRKLVYDKHLNGRVCRDCNNGWMSSIEGKVKPMLISMLDHKSSIHTTAVQSTTLAWWVYKTALTLHSASPYPDVIPHRHYELALQQRAPANLMIAIAHCSNRIAQPIWIQNQNWLGISRFVTSSDLPRELEKTYRITFGFGNFVGRVHYFPLKYELFEYENNAIRYIHPGNRDGFNWPIQPSIKRISDIDQSIMVIKPPEQDSEKLKQFLDSILNDQTNSENNIE